MDRKANSGSPDNSRSIRERAYLHIQRKIALGDLKSGSAISELELAKELGSSRTPIREAMGQLVAEGLLEQSPNRGAVVVQLTRQDIVELYELREALEVYAVGKAARQPIKKADFERLQRLADEILALRNELKKSKKTTLDPEQMHRFIVRDFGFHTLLMALAANGRILKVLNETRLLIQIFAMRRQGHQARELERIHRQHCEVLNAVAKQDAESAVRLIADHIQTSRQERLDAYDLWERETSLHGILPSFFHMQSPAKSLKQQS